MDEKHDALRQPHGPLMLDLQALYDVNARCVEMLARAAREQRPGAVALNYHVKRLLLRLTPDARARVARRAVLLTDVHFGDAEWWRSARDHPGRPAPVMASRGSFPRASAVQLMRATLLLTWHTLRSQPQHACVFGVTDAVASTIVQLSLTDIERIVERRFRHIRPRWEDRPAVWRLLLLAADSNDLHRMREIDLYGIQLVTGELWTAMPAISQRPGRREYGNAEGVKRQAVRNARD